MAFLLDVSAPCVQLPLCVQIWPQISLQSAFCLTALLLASRSRFSLSTVSVLLSTLYSFALTSQSALIRSFTVLRRIVRLERSASADGKTADPNLLRSFSPSLSPCVFHSWTPSTCSETKFVGRVLPERLDAAVHSQSSCRSIFCRFLGMLRRIFSTCEFPPTDFH